MCAYHPAGFRKRPRCGGTLYGCLQENTWSIRHFLVFFLDSFLIWLSNSGRESGPALHGPLAQVTRSRWTDQECLYGGEVALREQDQRPGLLVDHGTIGKHHHHVAGVDRLAENRDSFTDLFVPPPPRGFRITSPWIFVRSDRVFTTTALASDVEVPLSSL